MPVDKLPPNDSGQVQIAFLRPFDSDGWTAQLSGVRMMRLLPQFWFNSEAIPAQEPAESLQLVLGKAGRVVAIQQPEIAPIPGPQALAATNDWQAEVSELIEASDLVVIVVGDSPGVTFELTEALRLLPSDRVVLCLEWARRSRCITSATARLREVGLEVKSEAFHSRFASISNDREINPVRGLRGLTLAMPFAEIAAAPGMIELMKVRNPKWLRRIELNNTMIPILVVLAAIVVPLILIGLDL